MSSKDEIPVDNPLQGIRVLEIAQYIAGPMAGQQLADYGAEVFKIERPQGGDPFRAYDGGRNVPDYGFNFRAFNRNKKSLVLDLSSPAAADVIRRIAATVDVVIENFRPGVTERLGIGYEALKAVNPGVVYCAIAGFSSDGPFAKRPAFDTIGQALSGILYLFIDPKEPRMRGPTVADQVTAMQAATAILAMLRGREVTGRGGRIDISMIDAAVSFIPDVIAGYTDAAKNPDSETRVAASQAFIMRCADEKLIAVQLGGLEKAFIALLAVLGCSELAEDSRFVVPFDRRANWSALVELLRPYFAAQPISHWISEFTLAGVPFSEVLTIPEVIASQELVHSELLERREHPVAGPMTMARRPARIDKSRGPAQKFPPLLGEHTEEILDVAGYDQPEIAQMLESGLVSS